MQQIPQSMAPLQPQWLSAPPRATSAYPAHPSARAMGGQSEQPKQAPRLTFEDIEGRQAQAPGGYGALLQKSVYYNGQRRRMNMCAIVQNIFAPWLLFSLVYAVMSFRFRYNYPWFAFTVVLLCLLIVVPCAYWAIQAYKEKKQGYDSNPKWFIFLLITMLLAWCLSAGFGELNYVENMRQFYDIDVLSFYKNVDPSQASGSSLLDIGQASFVPGTHLNLPHSMGFKDKDIYCVVPIVNGTIPLASYDFWAVGKNCCSGKAADFHCNDYANPLSHGAVRLMDDSQRVYYRLAVQQAMAEYGIKAAHPLFFHWVQDPDAVVSAKWWTGLQWYLLGVVAHLAFSLVCVGVAVLGFSKMGY